MPSPYIIPDAKTTPWEYVGETAALGGIELTKLAKTYAELDTTDLSDLFPDEMNPERTIVIETMMESLELMPVVKPGQPAGNFITHPRMFRRMVEPAHFRQDDFLDQFTINQLKKLGTPNEAYNPLEIVQNRVKTMVNMHNRTLDFLRVQTLLGGINYTDPRTGVALQVSTQIPVNNFFRYDGFNATVAANATVSLSGVTYTAAKALTANKSREEAILFRSADNKIAVPWTNPSADIVRCLRLIKQYLRQTHKNIFTDMYLSGDLYTVLLENDFVKAYTGAVGTFNYTNSDGNNLVNTVANGAPASISVGPGGDITSIAGIAIHQIDQIYKDPATGKVTNMMPSNKVVLVAKTHVNDRSQTLGYTQYCVGESPDGKPGMWMRSGPDTMPPLLPGRAMQMGNAFLPYAMYPQWIAVLDVCEASDIDSRLILRSDLSTGTF